MGLIVSLDTKTHTKWSVWAGGTSFNQLYAKKNQRFIYSEVEPLFSLKFEFFSFFFQNQDAISAPKSWQHFLIWRGIERESFIFLLFFFLCMSFATPKSDGKKSSNSWYNKNQLTPNLFALFLFLLIYLFLYPNLLIKWIFMAALPGT